MDNVEVVVVVSDLHAGSTVSLCPPEVMVDDGNTYHHNAAQAWLWGAWREFLDGWLPAVLGGRPYALVHNGDATQGVVNRWGQLVSDSWMVQAQIAADLLLPLAQPASAVYMVKGTEVHVGRMAEHMVGQLIGAKPHPVHQTRAPHHWLLNVHGCLCSFRHHMPTTSRAYLEAGALSVVAGHERLSAVNAGHPVPRLVCRAHRHLYGHWEGAGVATVVTPSWQLSTTHTEKVAGGGAASVGAVVLDWAGRERGDLPTVRPYLKPLSAPAVEEVI